MVVIKDKFAMKIGIDCRLWDETGVGRYIRNLVKHLWILDHENEYVLFALSKDYESIKYKVLSSKYTKWSVVRADIRWHTMEEQLKFPSILSREKLDLMHFPYPSMPIFYNRPFVVTVHDLIRYHYPTGKASTLPFPIYNLKLLGYKFVIAQAARKAKKIIAVSNTTKKEIIDHLGIDSNKIAVTYEGVDDKISNSKSQIPNKYRNTKYSILNTQYFLYVGNAYPHKNLERLVEAFRLLCHPELVSGAQLKRDSDIRQNDMKLVFVGREDYFYKRLKEKVEGMGMEKFVKFLGEVSDEQLSILYRNALAFIIPSLMEGFGLPALEAMANRCLVLASDIPSLKETCGNGALYFNPLNIDELSEKLGMVAIHTTVYGELEKLRRRGVERARLFSWQKMAKETLKVYESCVGV